MIILLYGGLGLSQLGKMKEELLKAFPYADVREGNYHDTCSLWDGSGGKDKVFLIGHSMGGDRVRQTLCEHPKDASGVMIDPVSFTTGVSHKSLPLNSRYLWIRRSKMGAEVYLGIMVPLRMEGIVDPPIIWHGGHNELPNDPKLIEYVIDWIRSYNDSQDEGTEGRKDSSEGSIDPPQA
jgi:pimeloyl-ACP methyl ester carboxylesterase